MEIYKDTHTLQLQFRSTPPNLDTVMEAIREFLGKQNAVKYYTKQNIFVISEELIQNAHLHGNKNDVNKTIDYKLCIEEGGRITVAVEDEGNGYKKADIENPFPEDPKRIAKKGLILVNTLANKISLEKEGKKIVVDVSLNDSIQQLMQRSGIKHV